MAEYIDWKTLELKTPKIGFGTFSDVYKADWTTQIGSKREIVVKQFRDIVDVTKIHQEILYLSALQHDHIVKLFGISADRQQKIHILMEYADCGSLGQYLHESSSKSRKPSFGQSLSWMYQCAKGVAYLHNMTPKIIHRDLKPHNLLLFDNYQILKIGDFGTVTEMASKLTMAVGTAAYMAPEICEHKRYTEKCDVYSFGIILWEVMTYRKPFSHLNTNMELAIMLASTKGERPPLSAIDKYKNALGIKRMLEVCWNPDPSMRTSMEALEYVLRSYWEDEKEQEGHKSYTVKLKECIARCLGRDYRESI